IYQQAYREIEERLLKNNLTLKPRDIFTIYQNDEIFVELYRASLSLLCKNPETYFESEDFLEMKEDHFIQLLKCDDLELEEIKIWKYLIKWGIENTSSISNNDLTKWTPENFMDLKDTLCNCIPHVRFFDMIPYDYCTKVRPHFKDILPDGLDDEILQYFSDPNSRSSFSSLPLRGYPFESKVINAKDVALIASWIDKKQGIPYYY